MLVAALKVEVDAYVAAHAGERDGEGCALVVRNGVAQPHKVTTPAGELQVQAPRVNDRRDGCRFTSAILPPWTRRSPKVTEVLPVLYLLGISTKDFVPTLAEFLGSEAGLSASTIQRSAREWSQGTGGVQSARPEPGGLRVLVGRRCPALRPGRWALSANYHALADVDARQRRQRPVVPRDADRRTGSASCSLVVNQPLGPGTITASFLGDPFYLPSSKTKATIMFGFPAFGDFVIGDGNVQVAADDTFWGAQWSSNNTLSGGPAPQSFKGFASDTNEPPTCSPWTADPGNSGNPPDQVPSYMGVIVSSAISKSGPTVNGDTVEVIVVKTDPGYQRNPGHAGTGAVAASPSDPTQPAVYCHV
jgi:Transposase, Mutator family